jgi:hypothetical protein
MGWQTAGRFNLPKKKGCRQPFFALPKSRFKLARKRSALRVASDPIT